MDGDRVEIMKMKEDILEKAFGLWKGKIKGSSVEYVRKMRKEWDVRAKRLGI